MSFWSKAGEIARDAGKGALEKGKELVKFQDDDELVSKSKSWGLGSMEKQIVAKEMNNRGL